MRECDCLATSDYRGRIEVGFGRCFVIFLARLTMDVKMDQPAQGVWQAPRVAGGDSVQGGRDDCARRGLSELA